MNAWSMIVRACAVMVFVVALQACGGARHESTRDQAWFQGRPGTPLLWQVERDGAVSHVFGTIHVGVDLAEISPVVTERLGQSHTLIVESDTEGQAAADELSRMLRAHRGSLRTQLEPVQWQTLIAELGDVFPPKVLDLLPPWMVQTLLTLERETLRSSRPGMDTSLVELARDKGLRLMYLETPEEQLTLLAQLIDIDDLRRTLADLPGTRAELRALVRAYITGNVAALEGLTIEREKLTTNLDYYDRLLFARNRRWMKVLEPTLAQGGVFLAVGAAHYVGEDGLLTLLAKAGYRITRVQPRP